MFFTSDEKKYRFSLAKQLKCASLFKISKEGGVHSYQEN